MPINPFFNFTSFTTEQTLVEDLIIEAIQIYGKSVQYVKREDVNVDTLLGEDRLARYANAREIEVYLKSNIQFQGASETLSKFGLTISDDATFLVAVRRFSEEMTELARPRENDLIVIEMQGGTKPNRYIFEIRFVEDKEQLFQLGKLYVYELQCELWNYSHEKVATGNTVIDTLASSQTYQQEVPFSAIAGAFTVGEVVYQGDSFIAANFTGTVTEANTAFVKVKDITGEFVPGMLVGVTSNAHGTITATDVDINPDVVTDPIADNTTLQTESPQVVQPINNPRYS